MNTNTPTPPAKGAHPQTVFVPPEPGYFGTPMKPDYGEPWTYVNDGTFYDIEDRNGDAVSMALDEDHYHRAIACVNACAGMDDPAKEIEGMREAAKEREFIGDAAIARIQVEHTEAQVLNTENKAMREAIKAAHEALQIADREPNSRRAEEAVDAALGKLEPFMNP